MRTQWCFLAVGWSVPTRALTLPRHARFAFLCCQVFPYMRKRFGFMNVASLCGNFYYPIFSWDKPPEDERMNSAFFKWKCDHKSSIDTNHEFECDQVRWRGAAGELNHVSQTASVGVLVRPCRARRSLTSLCRSRRWSRR